MQRNAIVQICAKTLHGVAKPTFRQGEVQILELWVSEVQQNVRDAFRAVQRNAYYAYVQICAKTLHGIADLQNKHLGEVRCRLQILEL